MEITAKIDARMRALVNGAEALKDEMAYSLFAGGKRLRPRLLLAACETECGSYNDTALDFACAIEMIHTYSLIHDDLPAMDDDNLRRGLPTSHIKFGEAFAILAGDGLLNLAFETMAARAEDAKAARAMAVIARAGTSIVTSVSA